MSIQHREQTIAQVEEIISYRFINPDLCWEAVQVAGSGVYRIGGRATMDGNKNLAVLGDSAMKTVMAGSWIDTSTTRGEWQNQCDSVLCNANLGRIGSASNLVACLNKNPMNRQATSPGMAATLVEAVCGAVYKDGETAALRRVMQILEILTGEDTTAL